MGRHWEGGAEGSADRTVGRPRPDGPRGGGPRRTLARLMNLIAAVLMIIVFWTAIITAQVTWSERLGTIDLTSSVFFFPIIIGAAHATLHLLYLSLYPAEPSP